MNFNIVSKNNVGAVIALFLVILLSQSKIFNFLLDTALGRTILILFILLISYTNKILGVVFVLFIIIMFNNSDIGYLEGFNTPNDFTKHDKKSSVSAASISNNDSTNISNISIVKPDPSDENSAPATTSTEGFNTIENERNLQKGKQSNSIPVNNSIRESMSVEPFDGGSPFGNFGLY